MRGVLFWIVERITSILEKQNKGTLRFLDLPFNFGGEHTCWQCAFTDPKMHFSPCATAHSEHVKRCTILSFLWHFSRNHVFMQCKMLWRTKWEGWLMKNIPQISLLMSYGQPQERRRLMVLLLKQHPQQKLLPMRLIYMHKPQPEASRHQAWGTRLVHSSQKSSKLG